MSLITTKFNLMVDLDQPLGTMNVVTEPCAYLLTGYWGISPDDWDFWPAGGTGGKKSGDGEIQSDPSSGGHKYLYQMSWQFILSIGEIHILTQWWLYMKSWGVKKLRGIYPKGKWVSEHGSQSVKTKPCANLLIGYWDILIDKWELWLCRWH